MEKIDITKMKTQDFVNELPESVAQLDAFRQGATKDFLPVEISLSEYVQGRYGLSIEEYYDKLGVNPHIDTMQNVFTMPDQKIRWIVPEILRNAITLGITQAPFYPNIISADQPIKGLTAIMPFVNPSDATPARVNEAETIPLGTVSFGQKAITLFKIGKGFKITDEVKNYVSLDVMALFVRDFGVQLGYALDDMAIQVLINGNLPNGAESAPIIGVKDPDEGLVYKDLLRLWVRAARLGRNFQTMIGGEEQALDTLDLPEFKIRMAGTTAATLNLKTPVPNSADFYIHAGVPDDELLLVDPRAAMVKLTARQLMMESERIVSNQTEAIYCSLTTGFSKMYLDAAILIDSALSFDEYGFPDFMDIDNAIDYKLEN